MASKKTRRIDGVVWDSALGQTCPGCGAAVDQCRCSAATESHRPQGGAGPVRLRLDRKGRKGKSATLIEDLPLAEADLRQLAKALKKRAGTGGTVVDGRIEIQGDQRDLLAGGRPH